MKNTFYLPLIPFILSGFFCKAQISITGINDTVTIDFTGFTAAGFAPAPAAGQLSSNDWAVRGFSQDTLLDFGETATTGDFARGISTGSVNTGGIYAFDVGGGNAIFGVQPTDNDFTPGSVTLKIQNNTGVPVTDFEIEYAIWCYNDQNRSNSLNFSWSSDNITYSLVPPLNFATPQPLDSPASWVSTYMATLITGLNLANGSYFYLRWSGNDAGGSGSRDEYGVDNIKIIAGAPLVNADFSATDICIGDFVYFTDNSTTVTGSIISWQWYFGNGDSSYLANPFYYYSTYGTYYVTLIVTNNSGDTDSVTKPVTVFPVPIADFTAANFCQGSPTQFNNLSTIASGTIALWSWNFGDSTFSTTLNPSHIYSDTGTFTVTLTAISDNGCADSVSYSIIIYPGPIINTSAMVIQHSVCSGNNGSISGITVSGTGPFSYEWEDSSGNVAGNSLDIDSLNPGIYYLSVMSLSCTSGVVTVNIGDSIPAPAVTLTSSGNIICENDTVFFNAAPAGYDNYEFFLNSNSVQSGAGNSYFSSSLADGDEIAVVCTDNGCTAQSSPVVIMVNPNPVAGFTFTISGSTGTFTNTTSGGTPPPVYSWDFGDAMGTSNLFNPVYTYSSTGSYFVCLSVDDGAGCSGIFCDTVDISVGIKENDFTDTRFIIKPAMQGIVIFSQKDKIIKAEVINSAGMKIHTAQGTSANNLSVPLPGAGTGIYYVRIWSHDGEIRALKFIR
ncbi:MAG: PKD domain-containing protein [Bacteroidetes bacterium]|nr:PKD domain-containing protein [Bacteroidota bacterium]